MVRVHVKKWQQLCNIEAALEEIERSDDPKQVKNKTTGLDIQFTHMS